MESKLGIRIEGPEPDGAPSGLIAMAIVAMVTNLLTLYFLFLEFFELPLEPFLKSFMGLR